MRVRVWCPVAGRGLGVLGLCLSLSSAVAQTSAPPGDELRLQPGDRVLLTVWRQPELSGESVVSMDGTLSHPYYQTVQVAGIPLPAVKQRLVTYLSKTLNDPLVTVEPLFRVSVGGEVRAPNVYSLPGFATVAQAIAGAGGPTDRGRLSKVSLYRSGRQMRLDLNDPRSDQAKMPIRSGDNVIVGRAGSFFRDVLAPTASLTAAIVSIVVVFRQ